MTLTEFEKETALWKKIETELTDRLNIYRQRNDGNLSVAETDKLRGTIAMCKEILAWAEPPRPQIT